MNDAIICQFSIRSTGTGSALAPHQGRGGNAGAIHRAVDLGTASYTFVMFAATL